MKSHLATLAGVVLVCALIPVFAQVIQNLVFVTLSDVQSNQQIAVSAPLGGNYVSLRVRSGEVKGFQGYDPETGIGYFTLTYPPSNTGTVQAVLDAEEKKGRSVIQGQVAKMSPVIQRNIATWDNNTAKISFFRASPVTASGAVSIKKQLKNIAQAFDPLLVDKSFLPDKDSDKMTGASIEIRTQYYLRAGNKSLSEADVIILVVAILNTDDAKEPNIFPWTDVSDSTNVAGHLDVVKNDTLKFGKQPISKADFIWIVDNSFSMDYEQASVSSGAKAIGSDLNQVGLDWRLGLVTTSFYSQTCWPLGSKLCDNSPDTACRPFTNNITSFSQWVSPNSSSWIGAGTTKCQTGDEKGLLSLQTILTDDSGHASFVPPSGSDDPQKLRKDATLVVIFVGDADDQSYGFEANTGTCEDGITHYSDFLKNFVKTNSVPSLVMGGIVCPDEAGIDCGESQCIPRVNRAVINSFGGFIGDINTGNNIKETMSAITREVVSASSPYKILNRTAISSSVQVRIPKGATLGECAENVPRSRKNGFDYDPVTRTVVIYGNCRPVNLKDNQTVDITYSYWAKDFNCRSIKDQTNCSNSVSCAWCGRLQECRSKQDSFADCIMGTDSADGAARDSGRARGGYVSLDDAGYLSRGGSGNNAGSRSAEDDESSDVPWWAILLIILGLLLCCLLLAALLFMFFLARKKSQAGKPVNQNYEQLQPIPVKEGQYTPPGDVPQSKPYASPSGSAPLSGNPPSGGYAGSGTAGSGFAGGSAPSSGTYGGLPPVSGARDNLKPTNRPMTLASDITPEEQGDPNIKNEDPKYIMVGGIPRWPN